MKRQARKRPQKRTARQQCFRFGADYELWKSCCARGIERGTKEVGENVAHARLSQRENSPFPRREIF